MTGQSAEWIVLLPATNLEPPEGRGDRAYAINYHMKI